MVCTVCDPKLQLYPRDIYNAIVGGLQGCISTKTCIHPNLNQSVCEKLLHLRGEQKSFDKKKKSYSNIEVPVTFSGTKPFLNNDYKKIMQALSFNWKCILSKHFKLERL